jgi:hypothetical protein
VQQTITFAPACGGQRGPACRLVRQGQAWVGRGGLRAHEPKLTVTLIAVWTLDQKEPWVLVTDLTPERVGIAWYALRMSIELGFRLLNSLGWQWQHTRRRDPRRTARHGLILAVATLWTLAYGTRAEAAEETGQPPARLCVPPPRGSDRPRRPRLVSVFRRGLEAFCRCLARAPLALPVAHLRSLAAAARQPPDYPLPTPVSREGEGRASLGSTALPLRNRPRKRREIGLRDTLEIPRPNRPVRDIIVRP